MEGALLGGVSDPMRGLLLQLLLYKSIFMGSTFRELAEREEHAPTRDALVQLHAETAAEAAALTLAMRAWDAHPASDEGVASAAAEARMRFIDDLIALKDGVTDLGVSAAMRAPTDDLRRQILALADLDRRHADVLRELRGARTVAEHLAREPPRADAPVGADRGRAPGEPLARSLERTLDALRSAGSAPTAVVVGPDGLRHLRDEGVVDADTGRIFGLPVEVDMAWRGECFAVETADRIGSAELVAASRAHPEDAGV